ncbi:MAG: replication-associated recombination protein A [Gracilibacteraceae bacterium]|jgi:putative ATPase|nr:replication-associated recombination protein A [Gracilibacteraceae bacterium]
MNLFSAGFDPMSVAPLAERMRPRKLDEFLGQSAVLGPRKPLRRAIEADRITSVILYGPPGSGKTSLAQVIAAHTAASFVRINAVSAGVKELREIFDRALSDLHLYDRKTLVFCDEVHRFNKSQQDVLLPGIERGVVSFVGATTENPYFELNAALLSRSTLFRLEPLGDDDILKGLRAALADSERGLGEWAADVDEDAFRHWVDHARGDLRRAMNALELAVLTAVPQNGRRRVTLADAKESIQETYFRYDKQGDNHYDIISAFIKSMRGSDPDAALYWLAVLLEAGEDPRFIMRRILIHASEDVGLADPAVMLQAQAAARALEWVGLPEAQIPMAQAVLAIATAPKSNSVVTAIKAARNFVREHGAGRVPEHLRDPHSAEARLGAGEGGAGYLYPHNYPGHWVAQNYLPSGLSVPRFYEPAGIGGDTRQGQPS